VLAPTHMRQSEIDAFLQAKSRWIERTLSRLDQVPRPPPFASGLPLAYLDLTLRLDWVRTGYAAGVQRDAGILRVAAKDEAQARRAIELWYREEARHHALARIIHFAPLVGRAPKRLRIAGQKTRWGSCSTQGTISLNWRLMLVPAALFDYVVAHELCHLIAPHHRPPFWRELVRVMPDCEERRRRLHDMATQLTL